MAPTHPHRWLPLTSDVMGDAAIRCDAQVVALKPWGLLRGENGHVCLAFHALDILNPGTIHNRGFEKLRGLSQLGHTEESLLFLLFVSTSRLWMPMNMT